MRRNAPLGLLLAPGAGAERDHAQLVAVDDVATAAGASVVRMDFPYRIAGRRAPDRAPVLVEAVGVEADALGLRTAATVLGGRSMGGRMCSMAVAEGRVRGAAGLVLISYPLHPPSKPERMRTEHFPQLAVPCLFVSGTRDAFGSPEELAGATASIPGPVTHRWIEGKDHGLRNVEAAVAAEVLAWMAEQWPAQIHRAQA